MSSYISYMWFPISKCILSTNDLIESRGQHAFSAKGQIVNIFQFFGQTSPLQQLISAVVA